MIDGGGGLSITTYRSSALVKLSFTYGAYGSTEKANDAFNENLRKAVRVVEVTPKLNEHGIQVGQRAVAIFFVNETKEYRAAVVWTDGRTLYLIDLPSLLHAIDFEKARLGVRGMRLRGIVYALALARHSLYPIQVQWRL